jgi:hypothetical protein
LEESVYEKEQQLCVQYSNAFLSSSRSEVRSNSFGERQFFGFCGDMEAEPKVRGLKVYRTVRRELFPPPEREP